MTGATPSVLSAVSMKWDGPVVAAIAASRHLTIARRCADLAELLAAAASGLGQVAVVSAGLRGLTLSSITSLRDLGVPVVGLADPDDDHGERRLWQLGVHAVVSAAAPGDRLVAALLEALHGTPAQPQVAPTASGLGGWVPILGDQDGVAGPTNLAAAAGVEPELDVASLPDSPGRILAVWGPIGSPGRTTVAVNLAVEFALLGRHVVLVDADTYGGCVAQSLAMLDEAPGVVAAARAAEQGSLDVQHLARLALEVRPGVRVLTGLPKAERWPELREAAVERVLQVCRSLAEIVVVDTGFCLEDDEELSYDTQAPRRNQATLTALRCADAAVAVGGCDPVSLQRLVRGLQELGTVRAPVPAVVVNRLRSGPVGPDPARLVTDALARFAGVADVHTIPDDPVALDAALGSGRALAEISPGVPARKAIASLAAELDRRLRPAEPGVSGAGPGRHARRVGRAGTRASAAGRRWRWARR